MERKMGGSLSLIMLIKAFGMPCVGMGLGVSDDEAFNGLLQEGRSLAFGTTGIADEVGEKGRLAKVDERDVGDSVVGRELAYVGGDTVWKMLQRVHAGGGKQKEWKNVRWWLARMR
jgi:hypothetical protein